jgi:hypothetical protein
MSLGSPIRVLLQTTIEPAVNDWHVGRFSMLRDYLSSLTAQDGRRLFDVTARDRGQWGARSGSRRSIGRLTTRCGCSQSIRATVLHEADREEFFGFGPAAEPLDHSRPHGSWLLGLFAWGGRAAHPVPHPQREPGWSLLASRQTETPRGFSGPTFTQVRTAMRSVSKPNIGTPRDAGPRSEKWRGDVSAGAPARGRSGAAGGTPCSGSRHGEESGKRKTIQYCRRV